MASPDELFMLKTYYWLGLYQKAITEATGVMVSSEGLRTEQKAFMYRAYIGEGDSERVLSELSSGAEAAGWERAVRFLAEFRDARGTDASRQSAADGLSSLVFEEGVKDPIAEICAGTVLSAVGRFEDALRAVHGESSMEHLAVAVQVLLAMDRVELAEEKVKAMRVKDDESTLAQLASVWVNLAKGGEFLEEGLLSLRDLEDKFGVAPAILNGKAIALMGQGRLQDAEKLLMDALSQRPQDPDTLINLIALCHLASKPPAAAQRFLDDLRRVSPKHPVVQQHDLRSSAMERVATELGAGRQLASE